MSFIAAHGTLEGGVGVRRSRQDRAAVFRRRRHGRARARLEGLLPYNKNMGCGTQHHSIPSLYITVLCITLDHHSIPPLHIITLGGPKVALRGGGGGGWHGRLAKEGGGVPEMGFRAGPFVLCKDGCCHQRRRNINLGPENFFHEKIFPHICVVKMISATWGSF